MSGQASNAVALNVVVLGVGCDKCRTLTEHARQALAEVGRSEVEVRQVNDLDEVTDLGVLLTPALLINDLVLSSGRVISPEKITHYLRRIGAEAK